MSFIEVENISKTFKVAKKESGFKNSIKSFFKREYRYVNAIKDISFSIEKILNKSQFFLFFYTFRQFFPLFIIGEYSTTL